MTTSDQPNSPTKSSDGCKAGTFIGAFSGSSSTSRSSTTGWKKSSSFLSHINEDGTTAAGTTPTTGKCKSVSGRDNVNADASAFKDKEKDKMVAEKMKNNGQDNGDSNNNAGSDGKFDITFDCQDGFDDLAREIDDVVAQKYKARDKFWLWMIIMSMAFLALLVYGFVSGLFLGPKDDETDAGAGAAAGSSPNGSGTQEDRQQYYEELLAYFGYPILEPSSAQAQAMEWLAFEDTKFDMASNEASTIGSRLHQRYALASWYFDQGGPKFWTKINRDPGSGWIVHGVGVHECDWAGIDCQEQSIETAKSTTTTTTTTTVAAMSTTTTARPETRNVEIGDGKSTSVNTEQVVVGVRLRPSFGIVLTGTSLTPELGLLTNLRRLEAADQRLGGSIPDEWRTLTNLVLVDVSNNKLRSTIPSWISEWSNLEVLDIDSNSFRGSLPPAFYDLTSLKELYIEGNFALEGQIDELLVALPNLEYVDVSTTSLVGTLPIVESLTNLRSFKLWNAELTGTIPPAIGSWSNLETFSIGEVPLLEGTLPTEIGLLKSMKELEIKVAPNTEGTLPTEFGLMTELTSLTVSFANREGTLPAEYSNLIKLQKMDFRVNDITGTVPPEYANLTDLKYLDLRQMSLTGSLGDDICSLQFDILRADCNRGDTNNTTQIAFVCECCQACELV